MPRNSPAAACENVNLSGGARQNVSLSGSWFDELDMPGGQVVDVNLSVLGTDNSKLAGASIARRRVQGLTIDGIEVNDLLDAWKEREASRKASAA